MKKNVRVRFAPSPTGYLHIGGLRTALYNFLYAKKTDGDYYLRIEDTDQKRLVPDAVEKLLDSLHWAGITHNEGVMTASGGEIGEQGDFSPYIQSHRLDIYRKFAHELVEKGKAYYCFCSSERLQELRKKQEAAKLAPAYDKYCLREVGREEAERRMKNGEEFVIRFDVPEMGDTEFNDAVRGKIKFANINLDDFIILKSDGYPTYHFAHVIDDHLMGTTLVLRAEEWLPSTPKHILLSQAFGWEPPQYGHLCTILNKQTRKKLSKRDGDVSVEDFRKKGYLPEAVVNYIALLGWNPKTEQELFTLGEMVNAFSLDKLNKSGAFFDADKLDWMNGIYLRQKSAEELLELCRPFLSKCREVEDSYFIKVITVEKERMKTLADISSKTEFYFSQPVYGSDLLRWKEMSTAEILASLQKALSALEEISEEDWNIGELNSRLMASADPKNRGALLWPLRVSLSGAEKSPSPWEIGWVLGKNESIKRIKVAIGMLEQNK